MKVWITKYALSKGIYEADGEISKGLGGDAENVESHLIIPREPNWSNSADYFWRSNSEDYFWRHEWHRSKDGAIKHAEKMRLMKIASLKKQIIKLEKLDFSK